MNITEYLFRVAQNSTITETVDNGDGTTITYVGTARRTSDMSNPSWQIMRISTSVVGNTTTVIKEFPNSDDKYNYIWNNRSAYIYAL